jgi:hypothetical protein
LQEIELWLSGQLRGVNAQQIIKSSADDGQVAGSKALEMHLLS